MNEVYEDAINYLKYYGEKNNGKIESIGYFLDCELKNYIKLQSNWNSLREFFENGLQSSKTFKESDAIYEDSLMINKVLEVALDKMNELEGKDNNE